MTTTTPDPVAVAVAARGADHAHVVRRVPGTDLGFDTLTAHHR